MVTCRQLTLSLSHVERATVGLGITGNEEHEEGDDGRDMPLKDEPLPRTCLCLNNTAHLHGTSQDDSGNQTEAERHFIGNHLHGTTHGGNHRIFVVGAPTGQEDAYNTDRRNSGEQEHADIEVKHRSTVVPWQEREGTH